VNKRLQGARAEKARHLAKLRKNPAPWAQHLAKEVERWPAAAFLPADISKLTDAQRAPLLGAAIEQPLRAFAPRSVSDLSPAQRELLSRPIDPTGEIGDIIALFIPGYSESQRLKAAERMADRYPKPVYSKRRPKVKRQLKATTSNPKAYLRDLLTARLFEALHERAHPGSQKPGHDPVTCVKCGINHNTPGEIHIVRRKIRARLNALVSDDILGPGWRRTWKQSSLDETERASERDPTGELRSGKRTLHQAHPNTEARLEAKLSLESLLKRADLSPREKELVAEWCTVCDLTQAAQRLRIAPATARTLWMRAKKKLKDAL
jgi:DNA-binding CsgD family transcriptional regulator